MSVLTAISAPVVRRRAKWLSSLVLGLLSVAFIAMAWPAALGGQVSWVMVSGTSMEPNYHTGDMVVARHGGGWEVGDVVVYSLEGTDLVVEGSSSPLIVHRLVSGNARDGWIAQGDNKPRPDPWVIPNTAIQGVEVLTIPRVGTVLTWVRTPTVMALLAGLLVFWAVLAGPQMRRRKMKRIRVDEPAVLAQHPATVRDLHVKGARFLVSADQSIDVGSDHQVEIWVRRADQSQALARGVLSVRYDTVGGDGRFIGGPASWSTAYDEQLVREHCTVFALLDEQTPSGRERSKPFATAVSPLRQRTEGPRRWWRV